MRRRRFRLPLHHRQVFPLSPAEHSSPVAPWLVLPRSHQLSEQRSPRCLLLRPCFPGLLRRRFPFHLHPLALGSRLSRLQFLLHSPTPASSLVFRISKPLAPLVLGRSERFAAVS